MRKSNVSSITYGALFCALIGVLVYLNRLLAWVIEIYFFWIIPIPIIIYILKFDTKQAIVMSVAMLLMTMVLTGPISSSTFYVLGSIVAGLVYGHGLVKGKSAAALIGSLIAISLVMVMITVFVAASFFGYDVAQEVLMVTEMMKEMASSMGGSFQDSITAILTGNKILTIVIISYILSCVLEGILVHLVAYMVLRKLKMPTPPMVPIHQLKAPGWLRFVVFIGLTSSILAMITGVKSLDEYIYPFQVVTGVVCYGFGYIYLIVYLSLIIPDKKKRASWTLIMILISFVFPFALIGLGILDVFTNNREKMVERAKKYAEQQNRSH